MKRIDTLIKRAQKQLHPTPPPWVRAMRANPYVGTDPRDLVELLGAPRDDWRAIVQACAWRGGG